MIGSAIFNDANSTRGDLLENPVINEDDAIRDIFLQTTTGIGAITRFARYECGDTPLFEPPKQSLNFQTKSSWIGDVRK